MSIDSLKHEDEDLDSRALEVLIKEARRKARRRRLTVSVVVLVAAVILATIVDVSNRGPSNADKSPIATKGRAIGANYSLDNVANLAGSSSLMAAGSRVWVVINRESVTKNFFAVTELNASRGSLIRVIKDKGRKDLGNELNGPSGDLTVPETATLAGSHLWVTDDQYWKVAELNANNGALVRVIDSKADDFADPGSIAVSDGHVWVTNSRVGADSVTELNENNGSLVRVLKSKSYEFSEPSLVAASGGRVFVLNSNGDSVTEISASTGELIRIINARAGCCAPSNSTFEWAEPMTFDVSGSHLWIGDEHAYANGGTEVSSVVELNINSGSLVRVIKAKSDDVNIPRAIAVSAGRVWVQDGNNSITELNARNGSLVRIISTKLDPKGFNSSDGLAVGGRHVYVLNIYSGQKGSVTVLNASNGKIIRVIQ